MCSDCRIRALERKKAQFQPLEDGKSLQPRPRYPSRSKKIWRDRFEAARKSLIQDIRWFIRGRQWKDADEWLYGRIKRDGWAAQKYRKARAEAKTHGAI